MESKKKLNQKSISESRKKLRIEKHVSESSNIIQNKENYFKIENNVSESRNILLQESRKKSLKLNVFATFLHNTFIAFVRLRLVTVKSCFAQDGALKWKMNIISVIYVGIKQSLS